MDILEGIQMATKTLVANKLRSTLTMLGIIIGNASVIAMIGIGQGAQRLASEQFESLGTNVLFVIPGTRSARGTTTLNPPGLWYSAMRRRSPTKYQRWRRLRHKSVLGNWCDMEIAIKIP
jgi:hypothetical protein